MMQRVWTASLIAAMASCGQPATPVANDFANDNEAPAREPAAPVAEPAAPDRPASPPRTPIEDKSVAGAVALVERYAALLEQRRFAEARALWSDSGRASWLTEAECGAARD